MAMNPKTKEKLLYFYHEWVEPFIAAVILALYAFAQLSGNITINHLKHKVTVHDEEIGLTATEFKLLNLLAQRQGVVVSRDEILDQVLEQEHSFDAAHVHHLTRWPTNTISYLKQKTPVVLSASTTIVPQTHSDRPLVVLKNAASMTMTVDAPTQPGTKYNFVYGGSAASSATLVNTQSTGFTGADFKKASPSFDSSVGSPVIAFEIKPESANKFEEITSSLVGKRLIIFLDEFPITDAVVQQPIRDRGQITGNFTTEGTKELSELLNAGALPISVNLVQEKTIGATLGAKSVQESIRAGFVGLGMVLIFMILTYGWMGLIADVALVIFGILTLSLYKIIPVVLTLPGIAGFLLSVGMAVDSNILIFERFKEERKIREFKDALEVAFGRAWDSIRDANIATLVTAFILANPLDWEFLHTSGPVRGFAITLALGIGISLFTGIVVSRNLLRVFIKENKK